MQSSDRDVWPLSLKSQCYFALRNIAAETCFLSMFPCLPTWGDIVAEIEFDSQEAKMFSNKSEKF